MFFRKKRTPEEIARQYPIEKYPILKIVHAQIEDAGDETHLALVASFQKIGEKRYLVERSATELESGKSYGREVEEIIVDNLDERVHKEAHAMYHAIITKERESGGRLRRSGNGIAIATNAGVAQTHEEGERLAKESGGFVVSVDRNATALEAAASVIAKSTQAEELVNLKTLETAAREAAEIALIEKYGKEKIAELAARLKYELTPKARAFLSV